MDLRALKKKTQKHWEFTAFHTCASLNVSVINLNTGCEARYSNPLTEINGKGVGIGEGWRGGGGGRCLIVHCRA